MKAALAARPAHVLQERKAALAQLARTNPAAASVAVYNGWFLDTRVTIAFTCMVSVFIYALVSVISELTAGHASNVEVGTITNDEPKVPTLCNLRLDNNGFVLDDRHFGPYIQRTSW